MVVQPQFLAGQPLPASKLQMLGDETDYVPDLTASTVTPTLGTNSIQQATIWLNGQHVTIWLVIRFGTTGAAAGTGDYRISLPAIYPMWTGQHDYPIGTARLVDDSGSATRSGICEPDNANNRFSIRQTQNDILVTNAAPWTFANLDALYCQLSYLTDF